MITTTMGQLISELFDKYERCYHDETLAALATQAAVVDILRASRARRRRARALDAVLIDR
jgi:hypothetical protein